MPLYDGPIIDSHIHLFDTRRAQGIPWPAPGDVRYEPSLPEHYRPLASAHGITRAIVVEASPWFDDNQWLARVLHEATASSVGQDVDIAGYVGNLDLRDSRFERQLTELIDNTPLLGLRYGNLWERSLLEDMQRPECMTALRALSEHRLALDSANPDPALIKALLHITDALPMLTVIVDHLPNAQVPVAARDAYEHDLRSLASRPTVFAKLSEIPQQIDGTTVLDPTRYQSRFDLLAAEFGEDRILFGSDWPNSKALATFDDTVTLTKHLMRGRSPVACAKFFADNAVRAYGLTDRGSR
ncbi:amidohydrolase family protein [Robbsia sp. KACC 23696]|uniref:amidohydrolase family protein n=1 Tax=Robbsia sp. KACC 23696 TaxID=3149231 RepID=UPI00325B7355